MTSRGIIPLNSYCTSHKTPRKEKIASWMKHQMKSVESFFFDVWKSRSFSVFICNCTLFHPTYLKTIIILPSTKSIPGKSFSWSANGPVHQYPTLWFCWEAPDWEGSREEEQFSVNHRWTNKGRSCQCVCIHAAEHTELHSLIRKKSCSFPLRRCTVNGGRVRGGGILSAGCEALLRMKPRCVAIRSDGDLNVTA